MNFDLQNFTDYLAPVTSPVALAKLKQLDDMVVVTILNGQEKKFLADVRDKIMHGKNLTDRQSAWLAKILLKCKEAKTRGLEGI